MNKKSKFRRQQGLENAIKHWKITVTLSILNILKIWNVRVVEKSISFWIIVNLKPWRNQCDVTDHNSSPEVRQQWVPLTITSCSAADSFWTYPYELLWSVTSDWLRHGCKFTIIQQEIDFSTTRTFKIFNILKIDKVSDFSVLNGVFEPCWRRNLTFLFQSG